MAGLLVVAVSGRADSLNLRAHAVRTVANLQTKSQVLNSTLSVSDREHMDRISTMAAKVPVRAASRPLLPAGRDSISEPRWLALLGTSLLGISALGLRRSVGSRRQSDVRS